MRIDIFFAVDKAFVQHLSVAIVSILKNATHDDDLYFYILIDELSKDNMHNINKLKNIKSFNIEFITVDTSQFKSFLPPSYINSLSTFYRYIIPGVKPELKKVLYLDCDIVVKSSLAELFSTDLGDNYIAGVEDCHPACTTTKLKPLFHLRDPYLNAGVLLFNCQKMREDNIEQKCFELTHELNTKTYLGADQDVLNILCAHKKLVLDPKFNLLSAFFENYIISEYNNEAIENAKSSPVIIHYSGKAKPWLQINFPLRANHWEYFRYLRQTPFYDKKSLHGLIVINKKTRHKWHKIRQNRIICVAVYLVCALIDAIRLPFQVIDLIFGVTWGLKTISKIDRL